jgi:hypothetical protein
VFLVPVGCCSSARQLRHWQQSIFSLKREHMMERYKQKKNGRREEQQVNELTFLIVLHSTKKKIAQFTPSQERYVRYFEQHLAQRKVSVDPPLTIESIAISSVPKFDRTGGCTPWFCISKRGKELYVSESIGDKKGRQRLEFSCGGTLVNGDTRIDFYHRDVSKVRE